MTRHWYVGSFREKAPLDETESGGGVYVLDVDGGEVTGPSGFGSPPADVSWLVPHPDGGTIYALSRPNSDAGAVLTVAVEPGTGRLQAGPPADSGGAEPCHAVLAARGRVLLVANYSGGTVGSLLLDADGAHVAHVAQHEGSGPHADRQEAGHPHMVAIDPVTGHVLVPDLGDDRIVAYRLDGDTGRLTEVPEACVTMPAGSGPRHLAFFADGDAVVSGELDSTATLLHRDGDTLTLGASVSTLDRDPGERSYPSGIRVSGDLVYVANRGPDTVATLRREGRTLTLIGTESCGGRWPRDLVVDEDERRLLVANQYGGTVAVMPLDVNGVPGAPTGIWAIPNPGSFVPCPV